MDKIGWFCPKCDRQLRVTKERLRKIHCDNWWCLYRYLNIWRKYDIMGLAVYVNSREFADV